MSAFFSAFKRLWGRVHSGETEFQPAVLWFTGLSGSGKSTLAKRVLGALRQRGIRAEYLDGDSLRRVFPGTGFTRAERDMHIRRAGQMASSLEKGGTLVVASFISPYADARNFVRGLCKKFIEIYVSTPLEVCEKRDPKGLYAKARRGEIKDFTGIDAPYEPPLHPELVVDTAQCSEQQALDSVMSYLDQEILKGVSGTHG